MRFQPGDKARLKCHGGLITRLIFGRRPPIVSVDYCLTMGDDPAYDYCVRSLHWWSRWLPIAVRDEDLALLDPITMLGELA